jgi:hypothetical protein
MKRALSLNRNFFNREQLRHFGRAAWRNRGRPLQLLREIEALRLISYATLLLAVGTLMLAWIAHSTGVAVRKQVRVMERQLLQMETSNEHTAELIAINERLASAAKVQAEAAEAARNSMIGSQRAWVAPRIARLSAEPKSGEQVNLVLEYSNIGREPATNFNYQVDIFAESDAQAGRRVIPFRAACLGATKAPPGQIVYPASPSSGYSINLTSDKAMVDSPVIAGEKLVILQGCFIYETVQSVRHSYFCYFYKQGFSNIASMNSCVAGHHGD